jgi:hypothetical protein
MHSATTATGRPLLSPGNTLPKNRPASLACRATHQLAAQKPHVTSQLQRYIPAPPFTRYSSPATSHYEINRKPRRLESAISPTKQTPAPQINRQQSANSRITSHESQIANYGRSNRHISRLEIIKNPTRTRNSTVLIVTKVRFLHPACPEGHIAVRRGWVAG